MLLPRQRLGAGLGPDNHWGNSHMAMSLPDGQLRTRHITSMNLLAASLLERPDLVSAAVP